MRFSFRLWLSLIHIWLSSMQLCHNAEVTKTDLEDPMDLNNVTGVLQVRRMV